MKHFISTCLFIFLVHQLCIAQVTVQPFDVVIPCCSHSDSVDIGNDGDYDLRITSNFAIDAAAIDTYPLTSNMRITDPQIFGSSFSDFWGGAPLAQTTIACYWNTIWFPNTGHKYQGFRIVNAPADTTFGWIEYDFRGNAASCNDTIYGIKLAYSTIPNVHLTAGQTTLTGIENNLTESGIQIYPNPAIDNLSVRLPAQRGKAKIKIYDCIGQLKNELFIFSNSLEIDVANLTSGAYMLEVETEEQIRRQKFIKN